VGVHLRPGVSNHDELRHEPAVATSGHLIGIGRGEAAPAQEAMLAQPVLEDLEAQTRSATIMVTASAP
jgi:hypothetical protein